MSEKVIQSYVWHEGKCFFVSTINRESSAVLAYGHRYAETMIWECDPETRERGNLVGTFDGIEGSVGTHVDLCRKLRDTGSVEDEDV